MMRGETMRLTMFPTTGIRDGIRMISMKMKLTTKRTTRAMIYFPQPMPACR
jgi:hypothetical protein